jgi:hypothetical protein
MASANKKTLEDYLYRIFSKLIFLGSYLEATGALSGLMDVVENLKDEAITAIDLWEELPEDVRGGPVTAD